MTAAPEDVLYWHLKWGGRCQELVWISINMDEAGTGSMLDAICCLSDETCCSPRLEQSWMTASLGVQRVVSIPAIRSPVSYAANPITFLAHGSRGPKSDGMRACHDQKQQCLADYIWIAADDSYAPDSSGTQRTGKPALFTCMHACFNYHVYKFLRSFYFLLCMKNDVTTSWGHVTAPERLGCTASNLESSFKPTSCADFQHIISWSTLLNTSTP